MAGRNFLNAHRFTVTTGSASTVPRPDKRKSYGIIQYLGPKKTNKRDQLFFGRRVQAEEIYFKLLRTWLHINTAWAVAFAILCPVVWPISAETIDPQSYVSGQACNACQPTGFGGIQCRKGSATTTIALDFGQPDPSGSVWASSSPCRSRKDDHEGMAAELESTSGYHGSLIFYVAFARWTNLSFHIRSLTLLSSKVPAKDSKSTPCVCPCNIYALAIGKVSNSPTPVERSDTIIARLKNIEAQKLLCDFPPQPSFCRTQKT